MIACSTALRVLLYKLHMRQNFVLFRLFTVVGRIGSEGDDETTMVFAEEQLQIG